MNQSMPRVFISCFPTDPSILRSLAFKVCVRNGVDPSFYHWDISPGRETAEYLRRRIEESDLFVGIYDEEYGKKSVPLDDTEDLVSPIDFELQMALKVLDKSNIRLFMRETDNRDSDLNKMLLNRDCRSFSSDNEFALMLDEIVKDWRAWLDHKAKQAPVGLRTISISFECRDRVGIMAAIYRVLFIQGGDVIRSRQTTHLGIANATIIAQWHQGADCPGEEFLREVVAKELHALLGDAPVDVEVVRIITQDGEIKAKGFFEISFFDGPGIAERLFSVFAKHSTSVIESHLLQVSDTPPIAKFVIVANATNISQQQISHISHELGGLAGVFSVESYLRIGSWWY